MNKHPDEASPEVRSVWQRPGWFLIRGSRSPEAQAAADERSLREYAHKLKEVAIALEETKQSGGDLSLHCVSPLKMPTVLECLGIDFLQNLHGDFEITGTVGYEEECWTYTATMGYQWDPREKMWEYAQDLVYEQYAEGEIDLWQFADLLLEQGWALEEKFL